MSLDRITAPVFNPIADINWIPCERVNFSNGINLYALNSGTQDLVKIEWVFRAGTKYQHRQLEASFCSALLKEGTLKLPAEAFSEQVDYCGAFLNTEYDRDYASISLFCLTKYLDRLLPLVKQMITEPAFPQAAFDVHARNALQQFITDESKVATLARKKLAGLVMGERHYYGSFAQQADFVGITRDEVEGFHREQYLATPPKVFVSGKLPANFTELFGAHFGDIAFHKQKEFVSRHIEPAHHKEEWAELPGALQYAVRLGRIGPGVNHNDHFPLKVAVTILGGYFGSRLMKNIREEKGFTYGIHAGITALEETQMIVISTEVGNQYITDALEEIRKEAVILCGTLPAEDELALVKNYLAGNLVKDADGPIAQADKLRYRVMYNLPGDYYENYIKNINKVTPAEVQRAAEKYLQPGSFFLAVAGGERRA